VGGVAVRRRRPEGAAPNELLTYGVHIVALAGLPGTGKSALAREIARRLGCAVLDKDAVRVELFAECVDYSAEQNDRAMAEVYARVGALARSGAAHVVVDGRTYTRRGHVDELRALAERLGARLSLVECVCDASVARERIERDLRAGLHPARDRTPRLYDELRLRAEPIEGARTVLDTTRSSPAELAAGLDLH
jgi:predicted kinase